MRSAAGASMVSNVARRLNRATRKRVSRYARAETQGASDFFTWPPLWPGHDD